MSLDSKYPLLVRLYNRFFSPKPLTSQKLIEAAIDTIGLSDFGDPNMVERLDMLCQSINEEAQLHPFGTLVSRERLRGTLKNRLRAVEYFKQHPEVLQEQIAPPIIIAGLQRTGTTFLQRLLASDSDNRALLSWEALNPVPFSGAYEKQRRIKQAKISQSALRYLSPIFFSIHPVEYNSPEEDVLLNDMTFLSAVPEATMRVPSFSEWVAKQDHSVAYEWLHKMLQVLQWQQKPQTWVLKTPQHLEYMDVVAQQYPQATIIQTHRHPKECIPSFCSMVYHSRKIFSSEVNPLEVANHWVNKNVSMLQKTLQTRKDNPNLKVIDVLYSDLVKHPIETVKKIYEQLHRPWNERVEQEIQRATVRNKKNKYGQHHYDMADFGLTEAKIEDLFSFYLKQPFFH